MKRMTDLLLIATLLLSMTSVAYSTKDWTSFIRMDNGDDPGENSTGNSNCWRIATCILVEGLFHDEIYSSTSQNLVQQGKAIDLDAGAVTNDLPYTFIDIEDNRTKSENLGNFPNYTRAYWGIVSWDSTTTTITQIRNHLDDSPVQVQYNDNDDFPGVATHTVVIIADDPANDRFQNQGPG